MIEETEYSFASSTKILSPDDNQPKTVVYKVYKRRWFLLATLMVLNISNAMAWLTFGPIAYKTANFYNVTLDTVNWLSVVFMVTGIPCGIVATWLLDTLGLKISIILGAWLNCAGCVVRIVTAIDGISESSRVPVLFVGQTLAALAQPFVLFAPTKLAALWFPEEQRAISNTLATISNPLGIMLSGILSPILLPSSDKMLFMLGIQAIPAGVAVLMATFGWWSSKPATPPSSSAQQESEPFVQGLKQLVRNKPYLILSLTVGAGISLFSVATTLLSQFLCPWGYDDNFSGPICVSVLVGSGFFGSAIAGVVVDKTKLFTPITKFCFTIGVASIVGFSIVHHYPHQRVWVALTLGVFGFFGIPVYPIGNELAVEATYPVGEATSTGVIFMLGQLQGIILVLILQILGVELKKEDAPLEVCNESGDSSVTVLDMTNSAYFMMGYACLVWLIYLVFFKTEYRRINAENQQSSSSSNDVQSTPGIKVED